MTEKECLCSFCGKSDSDKEVFHMIAAPSFSLVFICDNCVKTCVGIIADAKSNNQLMQSFRKLGM